MPQLEASTSDCIYTCIILFEELNWDLEFKSKNNTQMCLDVCSGNGFIS